MSLVRENFGNVRKKEDVLFHRKYSEIKQILMQNLAKNWIDNNLITD